ncbi:hypothetical protein CROQUDRAFT_90295 [Cronartium quercuum f. sp. fusiforme G11]|uniref:F-box domain-containing protein n=1 Tax=Cronartium quercuum f. sp. fusiforme G11 TaxID=708437 RepID=A0A9P6NLY0_9BASI|nr:hypothetical protein CROQUDRAFT_90291 [Cronartium quercuum f. sp. fusiforme G11]KAG0148383.1 hypothetical protein CROQUDRAFT_90295 [Cronartium quercuum f. sp. fusiforme G11]
MPPTTRILAGLKYSLSQLPSIDLLNCLTVSKLWNQVASHHLWSSNPLLIPSRKSDSLLRARLLELPAAGSQLGVSPASCSTIRDLVLNLSDLHKNSIFVKERDNFNLTTTFPAIRTLTLVNSLLLSPFLLISLPQQDGDSASNPSSLAHRFHKQRLRQKFYHNLVQQIASLTELAHLNLINFEPTAALGFTPSPQDIGQDVPKSRNFDINSFLHALVYAFSHKASSSLTPFRSTALKTLNITKSRELVDSSLAGLSQTAPLYDNYQHSQLSFDLTTVTLIDCPLITANGFKSFLRNSPNLVSLKLSRMNNLFQSASPSKSSKDEISEGRTSIEAQNAWGGQDESELTGQLARYCSQLRSLTIEDITVPLTVSGTVTYKPIGVTKLHLTRCQLTSDFLMFFGSVRELRLSNCPIDDPSTRDYGFLAKGFRDLQSLSVLSAGTRSFTYANLDQLLVTSVGLRTLVVDGIGRASRSTEEEVEPQALDCEADLLTNAFASQQTFSNDDLIKSNLSEPVRRLPADVLSVFGKYDILASQIPSNVLVLLLSAAQALEGVGLFGRVNEDARESDCLNNNGHFVEPKAPAPLQLATRLLNRFTRWFEGPTLLGRPVCAYPPFPSRKPDYKRSYTFWFHDQTSTPGTLCTVPLERPKTVTRGVGNSKRLVETEIKLLKSKCVNLAHVWV